MLRPIPSRGRFASCSHAGRVSCSLLLCTASLFAISSPCSAHAQASSANTPVSVPAGLLPPVPPAPEPAPKPAPAPISSKQLREADDAYLEGAKQIEHKNIDAAERDFELAVKLDPHNRDYALALIVARESRVTELVQAAAKARLQGDIPKADALLNEARTLDPDNRIVTEHFNTPATTATATPPFKPGLLYSHADPSHFPAEDIASTLAGPVELTPATGTRSIHLHGDPTSVIRSLYNQFGITTVFDPSVAGGNTINIDIDKATFAEVARILDMSAHVFAVAIQPKVALIARDTGELREQLSPQVEETVYLPGLTNDAIQELANIARNVFDVKQVSTSATGGFMLLRGDENVLRQVNATYDDMLDGGSEVLFDINLYEIDKTHTRNIGASLPNNVGAFDFLQSATNLISSNQSILDQAIQNGLLTLTGSAANQAGEELLFLIAAGVSGSSQFTSALAALGTFEGLPLAGVTVGDSNFNLLLNSSDVNTLDAVQIRSSNNQSVNFRVGSRYPVITGSYSSGVSSSLTSALAGLSPSAAALAAQYLGSSSVTVPQFQFEDLGITLKLKPQIQHNAEVTLGLEMKIEALGGSSLDNIPILNNRALTSTITIPAGKTAMIATFVNSSEIRAFTGVPGLNEIPGFEGTNQDVEKDSSELLLTITPHIVRSGRLNVESRRLAAIRTGPKAAEQQP